MKLKEILIIVPFIVLNSACSSKDELIEVCIIIFKMIHFVLIEKSVRRRGYIKTILLRKRQFLTMSTKRVYTK